MNVTQLRTTYGYPRKTGRNFEEGIKWRLQECFRNYGIMIASPEHLLGRELQLTYIRPNKQHVSVLLIIRSITMDGQGLLFGTVSPDTYGNCPYSIRWDITNRRWYWISGAENPAVEGDVTLITKQNLRKSLL